MRRTTAAKVAEKFLTARVYPYGTPKYLLTDNRLRFVAKVFEVVCGILAVRHLLTTACHPQTNSQAEHFHKTLVTPLGHYVPEYQTDWEYFVQQVTYAYNMRVHRSTGTTLIDLVQHATLREYS